MATNVAENKIHIGENIRVFSPLTDSNGDPVPFSNLLTITGTAFDELGNTVVLVITADTITPNVNSLMYEIDTSTFREGKIMNRINMTFNSPSFPTSFATDIIEQELFNLVQ